MAKGVGGRPREGEHVKTVPIGIRTDPELRAAIEQAAAERGVSMTQEIEARLRSSFEHEQTMFPPELHRKLKDAAEEKGRSWDTEIIERLSNSFFADMYFGSSDRALFLRTIGAAIDLIEGFTKKKFTEDWLTWRAAAKAIRDTFGRYEPKRSGEQGSQIQEAKKELLDRTADYQKAIKQREDFFRDNPAAREITDAVVEIMRGNTSEEEYRTIIGRFDRELMERVREVLMAEEETRSRTHEVQDKLSELERQSASEEERRHSDRIGRWMSFAASGHLSHEKAERFLTGTDDQASAVANEFILAAIEETRKHVS